MRTVFLECFFLFFLQARVSLFRYSSPLYNEKWDLVESFKEKSAINTC